MLKIHAQIVIPQFAFPKVSTGVILLRVVVLSVFVPFARFIGISIPHPSTVITRKIFRHIIRILRKTTASSPIKPIKSCSFVLIIGVTQANIPFPIGGGACLSSATLSFGAYTREL